MYMLYVYAKNIIICNLICCLKNTTLSYVFVKHGIRGSRVGCEVK